MIKNKFFYIRNKKFWEKYLSNYNLEFYEFKHEVHDELFFKGISGVKLR